MVKILYAVVEKNLFNYTEQISATWSVLTRCGLYLMYDYKSVNLIYRYITVYRNCISVRQCYADDIQ